MRNGTTALVAVGITTAIPGLVGALLLWGILVRNRLAWQWARLGAGLRAILGTVAIAKNAADILSSESIGILLVIIPYWTVVFSMGSKSAKTYFNLVCPSCGQLRGRAADFFFRRAKCGPCKTEF